MKSSIKALRSLSLFIIFSMSVACAAAQNEPSGNPYQPQYGQEGKDVIWVPTPEALVEKMLDMAQVTPDDYVIDLGSGDGRTVIAAAKRGARALGVEYNPNMVAFSIHNAEIAGVSDKASFVNADLFATDFSDATVLTMFLLPSINLELRPHILTLNPGTRIVSNTFDMGDWEPDEKAVIEQSDNPCESHYHTALLWVVPARVEGYWVMEDGNLTLSQNFQFISGTIQQGETVMPVENGRLHGDIISFQAGDRKYKGRVSGNVIEGSITDSAGNNTWKAMKSDD